MANVPIKTHRGIVEAEAGQPFTAAIKNVATGLGLAAFRVFLAGVEIADEAQAPATLEEGMAVAIQPDDIAG